MINLAQFAKEGAVSTTTNGNSRPKRQINAAIKETVFNAMNATLIAQCAEMVADRGLVIPEGHFRLTNEEISTVLRTAFNALNGPTLTLDKDSAIAAVEELVEEYNRQNPDNPQEEDSTEEDSTEEDSNPTPRKRK